MNIPRILLTLLLAHLFMVSAESEGRHGLRKKLVKVVKRKRVETDQEREGRSIIGSSFPFIEEAKHTIHASQQQHHPQRISALRRTSDPSFLAKLREHERQREFVFGRQEEPQVSIRPRVPPAHIVQSSTPVYHEPIQAPTAFAAQPASVVSSAFSNEVARQQRLATTRRGQYQGNQDQYGGNQGQYGGNQGQYGGNQGQSDADALREHSAALRRHKEQLEAAKRLIKFHQERYLKHQTGHIVPIPAQSGYRPSPPIPQTPVIANRRRQQVRRFKVPRPRPTVSTTVVPTYQPALPEIQGYIEPAIQVQSHAQPVPRFPEPQQVVRTSPEVIQTDVAPTISLAEVARERCIDKVVYVEEIVEDDTIECHHSYEQKCHVTYVTDFKSESEEECEENFKKDCFIEYKPVAMNDTVQFCHTPIVKDCNVEGPVVCKTEYETECRTRYHEHQVIDDIPECKTIKEKSCREVVNGYKSEEKCQEWPVEKCSLRTELVTKTSPETKCEKIPKEICAPKGCGFVPGIPECFDKTETIIQDIPEETCNLQPQKHCKQVTKLVPNLQPTEECVDVPKEVCTKSAKNPRKVKKPVTKKWCYTPSNESGLI